MNLFQSLLGEITKKLQGTEIHKDSISKELTEIVGFSIHPDQVMIRDKKVFISLSPTLKTKFLLKRSSIETALKKYGIHSIG